MNEYELWVDDHLKAIVNNPPDTIRWTQKLMCHPIAKLEELTSNLKRQKWTDQELEYVGQSLAHLNLATQALSKIKRQQQIYRCGFTATSETNCCQSLPSPTINDGCSPTTQTALSSVTLNSLLEKLAKLVCAKQAAKTSTPGSPESQPPPTT